MNSKWFLGLAFGLIAVIAALMAAFGTPRGGTGPR